MTRALLVARFIFLTVGLIAVYHLLWGYSLSIMLPRGASLPEGVAIILFYFIIPAALALGMSFALGVWKDVDRLSALTLLFILAVLPLLGLYAAFMFSCFFLNECL